MNQQNISKTPDLLVKRKRGRPRKDESAPRNVKQHTQPPLAMAAPPQPPPPAAIFPANNNLTKVDPNMVGQVVTCVIDGIFDNGYLLSARVGPTNSLLRGIVFQHGHVVPVTSVNDVAPHVEMCTRGEFTIPPSNPGNPVQISTPELVCAKQPEQPVTMENYQNTPAMVTGGSSMSLPQESLRLIDQDDIMQVFEVSKTVEEPQEAKNEHVVSDPAAANNLLERENIIHKDVDLEQVVNEQPAKEPEVIPPVDTTVESQPAMQESQEQTGM